MTSVIDVTSAPYNAVPDAIKFLGGSCSGTGASCPTASFTGGDVGKQIKIIDGYNNDGIFRGTIASVPNSTTLVLSGSVVSTVSGTATIYIGTDNSTALQAAFDAAEAIPVTSDVKIKVIAPSMPDGGGYLFCTPLTSNNINIDFDAPIYASVGLGNADTTVPWVLGNSDITNLYIDVTGSNGLDWGQAGFHKLYLTESLEIDNPSFNGQVGLTCHGYGFNITGTVNVNKGSGSYNFTDCQDIHCEGLIYANGCTYGPILNGTENSQLNIICDTVGSASFLMDGCHGVKLNVQNFVNGSNTASTGLIGTINSVPNHGIQINLLAQTSGGPSLFVDYCDGGVNINITATNKRMNSGVHNDITYAVSYGSHNSGTLNINVTRDSDIPAFTGTQYGNLTDTCAGVTTIYGTTIIAGGLVGTTTNNNAATGCVGQADSVSAGPVNAGTSGQFANITSLVLDPGDYDVTGTGIFDWGGANVLSGNAEMFLSEFTGNTQTDLVIGDNYTLANLNASNPGNFPMSIPNWRVKVATGTTKTIYIKGRISYTAGMGGVVPKWYGRLSYRRER